MVFDLVSKLTLVDAFGNAESFWRDSYSAEKAWSTVEVRSNRSTNGRLASNSATAREVLA